MTKQDCMDEAIAMKGKHGLRAALVCGLEDGAATIVASVVHETHDVQGAAAMIRCTRAFLDECEKRLRQMPSRN
jgi:hypothetical protein